MKGAIYGIDSFKIQAADANGFPTSWEGAFSLKAIVKDSMSFNDAESSENDIEVEDSRTIYATLPSSTATEGFTVQTYDMSQETFNYLMGYAHEESTGWNTEVPSFMLGNQAVQIITKEFADFPSKTFEWANMNVKVTKSGTVGKSGFPNFNLTFKKQIATNSSGEEIGGARWKLTSKA